MERKPTKSNRLSKVLIKVLRGREIKWVHFCYIPQDLYKAFFDAVCNEKSEFGAFLSSWALKDFSVRLNMSTFEDVQKLKALIKSKYMKKYIALYAMSEESLSITGWVRVWVSQHMKAEITKRGL